MEAVKSLIILILTVVVSVLAVQIAEVIIFANDERKVRDFLLLTKLLRGYFTVTRQ
jgi:heme/copper-type cytochrome/quinol oxidase subunit 3